LALNLGQTLVTPSRLAMMSVPSFQFMISYRQTNALQRPQRLAVGWIPRVDKDTWWYKDGQKKTDNVIYGHGPDIPGALQARWLNGRVQR
jgi:hypothetical protein